MIEVVDHDPRWVEDFAQLRQAYANVLSERCVPVVGIEHVGSTAVRDTLRADRQLREEYADVKRQIGAAALDIDDYGQGKSAVIQRILAAAGLSDTERSSIAGHQVPARDDPARRRQ